MKLLISFYSLLFVFSMKSQDLSTAYDAFNRFEYEESINHFENVQIKKSLGSKDLKHLAYAYYTSGYMEKCLNAVDQLILTKKEDPIHHLFRADALKELRRFEEAKNEYINYSKLDTSDQVNLDISSCDYLAKKTFYSGYKSGSIAANTPKADAYFEDLGLGKLRFQELGEDSLRKMLDLGNSNDAELMLMRPYSLKNEKWILFPKTFNEYAITSISKNPKGDEVLFTAYSLLEISPAARYPHIYEGHWNDATNTVSDCKPWEFSGFKDSSATAFAHFHPNGNGIVFSKTAQNASFSDLYFSTFSKGNWLTPISLVILNSDGEDMYAHFTTETELQFSSTGRLAFGNLDVYSTKWNSNTNTTQDTISHLESPINTGFDDFWMFKNKDTVTLTSNRTGSRGEDNVWQLVDDEKISARLKAQFEDSMQQLEITRTIEEWTPKNVYFNFKTNEPNTDYSFMNMLSNIIINNSEILIEVNGYTDMRGLEQANAALSESRAEFVTLELVKRGIPKERIKAFGKGDVLSKSNSNESSSEEAHQKNRVAIITLKRKN